MSRKLNLKKGQKVVVRYINDKLRGIPDKSINGIDRWAVSGEATKVGRKYIYVKIGSYNEQQFDIEDDYRQKTNIGSPDYKLYTSKEEILAEIKAEELYTDVKRYFSSWSNDNKFTLDQLERVKDIVKESEEELWKD